MSWEPNWEAEAAELAAPLIVDSADFHDDDGEGYGSPCCPKCEMYRRAMDECDCFAFGGDDL